MTTLVLAVDQRTADQAAHAYGFGDAVYVRDLEGLRGLVPHALVRVEGWERSDVPVRVVVQAVAMMALADADDITVPSADFLRRGEDRARLARRELARWRRAQRTLTTSLDPQALATEPVPTMTWSQRLRHRLHLCPRELAGHPCNGAPGRCGWGDGDG